MPKPVSERVGKHRSTLRAAGLRPIQIWVPDTRSPGFAQDCQRQAQALAIADKADRDIMPFLDAALLDMDDDER